MDQLYSDIRSGLISPDPLRVSSSLLFALQLSAAGRDISSLLPSICSDVLSSPTSGPTAMALAFDCIRSSRLSSDDWESVCRSLAQHLRINDETTAVSLSFLPALPSWRLGEFLSDTWQELGAAMTHDHPPLRAAAVQAVGRLLVREDVAEIAIESSTMLERVMLWWRAIGEAMADSSDSVSAAAFASVGSLFGEFSFSRRRRGEEGEEGERRKAEVLLQAVAAMAELVWSRRGLLMDRAALLPLDGLRNVVYPLTYAAQLVASGMLDNMKAVIGNPDSNPNLGLQNGGGFGYAVRANNSIVVEEKDLVNAERMLGVSDIVSFLAPYLSSSLDPALIYEVGIHVLSLAGLPGGKPEWAAGPITAFLALWDRNEYTAGREAIVKAVVSNIQLLDLHLQVALFKRILVMVRNLRVEADRMHALACICRTALCVDLFVKESARRGQKPLQGTDIASFLFEDPKTREEFAAVKCESLFREELLACLIETTFQLSQPPPNPKSSNPTKTHMHTKPPLSQFKFPSQFQFQFQSQFQMQSALEVLEGCRGCLKWECGGRTYAMDCYLRLLVKLCAHYDTAGGVKSLKDGQVTSEQVQVEQRLQALHRQLLDGMQEVATPRLRVRVLWALAEHLDLSGSTPLFADEPREPLNVLVTAARRLLHNADPAQTGRLQDVQAILVCALHLGVRNKRAAAMVVRELDDFRSSPLADASNRNHCRQVLNLLAAIQKFPERQWAARVGTTGEYPFTHHKLSVQYREGGAAQDRKLEVVVRTAVRDLWQPKRTELHVATSGVTSQKRTGTGQVLAGCSDPVLVDVFHVTDVTERRITLHVKILNISEVAVGQVDVQIGLVGGLKLLNGAPKAVRRVRGLGSHESLKTAITVTASRFEISSFCVQLSYYIDGQPTTATLNPSEEFEEIDENGAQLKKVRKQRISVIPDPVVLRCKPYRMPLTDLLLPYEVSPVEFFRIIAGLPYMVEHTGKYEYESSERNVILNEEEIGVRRLLTGLKALERKPLHLVCQHILRSRAGFQLCYMAKTWYGEIFAMVIFGSSDIPPDGGFGEELTSMLCKFVLKSSVSHVLDSVTAEPQHWLDDLTDGSVRVVTEEELKTELEEKQRRTAQHIALLKKSMKEKIDGVPFPGTVRGDESEEEEGVNEVVEKQVPPLVPEEQQALQAAVLQGWSALKARQVAIQNRVRA